MQRSVGAILLSLAILGSIVVVRDFKFVVLVEDDRILARRFGRERAIDFMNVSEVGVSQWGPIESMSIRDSSSNKIVFNRFLQDYVGVKRFISDRCE